MSWISLNVLIQDDGGGCSLNRTALCDQFPITGKNTGNFDDFGLETPDRNRRIAMYPGQLSNSILD
jgi:hypothetical protein